MALDGIVTHGIVHELQRCIGARIHKIHQPSEHELVLSIRGAGTNGKLLISANPTYPRIHWTNSTPANPLEAPMFCMLLRKHCESGIIEAIRQIDNERIIHMDIKHRNEVGDISTKTIIIEIMGRHSNIILIDPRTGAIYDGIHHVTPAISSHRIVMPGSAYAPPPDQGKANPLHELDQKVFIAAIRAVSDSAPLFKRIVEAYSGISPLLAKEMVSRASAPIQPLHADSISDEISDSLWESFSSMMAAVRDAKFKPCIVTEAASDKSYFSVVELTHLQGQRTDFQDVSSCLEAFYGNKAERDTVKQRAADLIRFVHNEKTKNETKLLKLEETLTEAKDADKYKVLGELLTAYMHQINRGDTSVELINFYDEEQAAVTIELDPQLSPSENAQRYFRRYTKQRNSMAVVGEQMDLAREEISYFESLLQQLDSASLADIEEIRDELIEQGYMKERSRRGPKKKKAVKPMLMCYTSSEGIAIYVGKNNTQNEYLTNRLASSSDTWLHTKDIPGSHVVIKSSQFGDATLEEAAMLSAYYSQARESSMVPVDYTSIRHVRKPSGAKPGFVIYDNQKTLFITPDIKRIESLDMQIK